MTKVKIRGIIIVVAVILAFWQLSYTWRYAKITPEKIHSHEIKKLRDRALKLGLDLRGGVHLILEVDTTKLTKKEMKDACDRALEILRNRIDQFGVSEPLITKYPGNRIMIQLPGVVDVDRAKEIIGKTAMLEFRLVEKEEITSEILKKIDEFVYKKLKETSTDTMEIIENPLLTLFYEGRILEADTHLFNKYVEMGKEFIPQDEEFLWNQPIERGMEKSFEPLLVKKEACLKGDAIIDAQPGIGTENNPIGSRVDLTMSPKARAVWARITGANIGRRIAIILDNIVQTAPVVRERIAGGRSVIEMGGASFKEAKDLAVIIRAGALPAPVNIVEESTIGPSLGRDSIRAGIKTIYISAIVIVIFMIIYYAVCGLVANLALLLNILFLLALMSGFGATLTLPGIAGIVLVFGTGVDANILIYERIKEEIGAGKTLRTAIDAGFSNAFRTILDANITTLLAGVILYFFGKGPIKGFGITLSIGTAVNLFTAIVVTKIILDYFAIKGIKLRI